MGKRYYWYKMQKNFFDTMEARCLLSERDGDSIMVTYLRLSCMAIDNEGVICFRHSRENIQQEISAFLGKKTKKTEEFLQVLEKNGFLEYMDDGSIFLPKVVENTGSEGESAPRMRKSRTRHNVQKSDVDIENRDRCREEIEKGGESPRDQNKLHEQIRESFKGEPQLAAALCDWTDYKNDRGNQCSEKTTEALIASANGALKHHSAKEIVAEINKTIGNGWSGIRWDEIGNRRAGREPITSEEWLRGWMEA